MKYEIKYIDGDPYVIKEEDYSSDFDIKAIKLDKYITRYMLIDAELINKYAVLPGENGPHLTINGLISAIRSDIIVKGYVEHGA